MNTIDMAVILFAVPVGNWRADWALGVPLVVLTLILHVIGLLLIDAGVERNSLRSKEVQLSRVVFVVIIGTTTLLATVLHWIEVVIWAVAYRLVGALSNNTDAVLYSLSAITSYGHTSLVLEKRWQLMGALEALNGWLLFGLTAAFMFGIIQRTLGQHKNEHN